jgi:hypothetical protein
MESRVSLPLLGIMLLWSVVVLVRYYSSIGLALDLIPSAFNTSAFPSLDMSRAPAIWWESLLILLTGILISWVTLAWGRRIRLLFSIQPADSWIKLGVEFGLGIIFWDLFWIGSGLTRIWYKPFLLISIILFSTVIVRDGWGFWRTRIHPVTKFFPSEAGYRVLLLVGTAYWLFSLAHGLVPEAFYDSMVYHLAVPQYWFLSHGICDFPTNFFSNYPYGGELFYMGGILFQGTETAKLLHAVAYGFCALFAGGWARETAGERAGWLALGLTLSLPLFSINVWSTQVEGLLALASLLFLYSFYHCIERDRSPAAWAALTGAFMALAFSIKYTSALVVLSALGAMALLRRKEFSKIKTSQWGIAALGIFLLTGPWVLKNYIFTGNPFFPYFMALFKGRHLTPWAYQQLLTEQQGRVAQGWQWLYLPWKAVMANPDGFNFAGPLALAAVPWLFFPGLRRPAFKFLAWVVILFFIGGFWVTHILRFLGTGFILVYILLGCALTGGSKPAWGKGLSWVGAFSALLCFGYLSGISAHYSTCAGVWSGRQTRAEYLMSPGKITPYYDTAQWINQNLPPEAHLLIVGDARGLYYDRPFVTNSVFDEQELSKAAREEAASKGIAQRLKELGVDYLVVNGAEGIRVSAEYHHYDLTADQWKRLDDFIQQDTEAVYQQGLQGVYHVLSTPTVSRTSETLDLVLFFSNPASQFVKDVQRRQWGAAEDDLNETLGLYPFSKFWKEQKNQFDQSMKAAVH